MGSFTITKLEILSKLIYKFKAISIKTSTVFLQNLKTVLKYKNNKKPSIARAVLEKNMMGRPISSDIKNYYNAVRVNTQ